MVDRIWIAWERQRRSRELARYFDCQIFEFTDGGLFRYLRVIARTLATFLRRSPRVIFVQNPSTVLAALAVPWSLVTRVSMIDDRHSTFLLKYDGPNTLRLAMFRRLHALTLRQASMTIVTNEHLAGVVRGFGGTAVVLPDRLPDREESEAGSVVLDESKVKFLLACSFANDKPIGEVPSAVARVREPAAIQLYVSGRVKPSHESLVANAPSNVSFTGFLSDEDYGILVREVDGVLALTTLDYTMLCGCYEAVSAEKPLITSDFPVLREYFTDAVFVDNSISSITDALECVVAELGPCRERIQTLRARLTARWSDLAQAVDRSIDGLLGT